MESGDNFKAPEAPKPPKKPFQPTTYYHTKCGQKTSVSTADALELGEEEKAHCIGCHEPVPVFELLWVGETGAVTSERVGEP